MIKGGVWKNTEDEILKAAVMKYGKNQWARISSLLVRKSAKQCKARWNEWLDPSIKKTEWSREEEEKLLHLAKLMPCQWRTIAPIVGRTAAQCLEHYEKLLDQAQDKEDGVDANDDPRRLRPGEIDPNPESKPARPDPVDMDEDEKEMLSEARARLANTQGKKAKRKAREKQLSEARRLAALQKRRELKAAGIDLPKYRRKRGVDYITEVPFERKAPAGFFSAMKEGEEAGSSTAFKKVALEGLEGKRRDKEEEEQRKKDKQKLKRKQEKNMPAAVMEVNKLNDAEQVRKRTKLVLGTPQVTERELDEIAKMQERGMSPIDAEGSVATRTLMGDYTDRGTPALAGRTPMRTPKSDGDNLRQEAQNLIALTTGETPLKGGLNAPLHDSDFTGATPKPRSAQTPNPIATPLHGTPGGRGATPLLHAAGSRGTTPASTPRRDQLGLNDDIDANLRSREQRRALQDGLSSLPAPAPEYELIAAPDEEEELAETPMEMDAADLEEQQVKRMHTMEKQAMKERSTPLKRKLPRPLMVQEDSIVSSAKSQANDPEYLLEKEMYDMVQDDATRFPIRNAAASAQADDPSYVVKSKSSLPYYSHEELAIASEILKEELVDLLEAKNISKEDDAALWEQTVQELIHLPTKDDFGYLSTATPDDLQASFSETYDELRQQMTKDAKKANKLERKLQTLTAGYQRRAQQVTEEIQAMHTEQETKSQELQCFTALQAQEEAALAQRVATLKEEVELAQERETRLQQVFKEKMETLNELRAAGRDNTEPL